MLRVAGARQARVCHRKNLQCIFPECSKTFYAQSGLTQHILRKHRAPSAQQHTPHCPERGTPSSCQAVLGEEHDDIDMLEYNPQSTLFDDVRNSEDHGIASGRFENLLGLIKISECIFKM